MAREFKRSDRVGSQIQRELAELIKSEVDDPRLGFVTVNAVEVVRDLAVAKVYFSVLGADKEQQQLNFEILNHAAAFLRRQLAHVMRMRSVPELRFIYDDSIDRGMRMDALLKDIAPPTDGPAE